MTAPFKFKLKQKEDLARLALHNGGILGWDTGCGKGLALYAWPVLKVGFENLPGTRGLKPLAPVLFTVPGDLHQQVIDEGADKFSATVTLLDTQETFLRLSTLHSKFGTRNLPPGYYITSYTQLTGNGVTPFPKFDRFNPGRLMQQLGLSDRDCETFFGERGTRYKRQYEQLGANPEMTVRELESCLAKSQQTFLGITAVLRELQDAFDEVHIFACRTSPAEFSKLDLDQQSKVRARMTEVRWREYSVGIGETRWYGDSKIKCVYSPSLADLCQDAFDVVAVDEGVRMKGDDTRIGTGVRQMNARYKLVLTATPIKNRLPDVFWLAWWAAGAKAEAHARFPYPDDTTARQEFAEEFLISERNLTKEENSETNRRFVKLTPQVCNVHRLWRINAPVILRRRKQDFGEDIVQKIRHVVRCPLGREQADVYKFHLDAKYKDINGKPAIGAQLQALRIAAANPTSTLLERPYGDMKTKGEPHSHQTYIPKLHSALKLIHQILERKEQVIVFSAFHDSLDALSSRLNEASVKHAVLDGRTSQKKRGVIAGHFKLGPPKAPDRRRAELPSPFPVVLAGVECMSEGHSFHRCNNVILLCYSWAWDKFEQAINRVHRLNSLWDVNIYCIICDGSIDRKLDAMRKEKGDAAELVLDGHLLGEHPVEVNLAELLNTAHKEFSSGKIQTVDEWELVKEWPALRAELATAAREWGRTEKSPIIPVSMALLISKKLEPEWRKRFFRGGRLAQNKGAFEKLRLFA